MDYVTKQKAVVSYVKLAMMAQGASLNQAIANSTKVYFFNKSDVENLYEAIESDLDDDVVKAIVAHDFNGLADHEEGFLPKSVQFA